jgi:hypothetical protein
MDAHLVALALALGEVRARRAGQPRANDRARRSSVVARAAFASRARGTDLDPTDPGVQVLPRGTRSMHAASRWRSLSAACARVDLGTVTQTFVLTTGLRLTAFASPACDRALDPIGQRVRQPWPLPPLGCRPTEPAAVRVRTRQRPPHPARATEHPIASERMEHCACPPTGSEAVLATHACGS